MAGLPENVAAEWFQFADEGGEEAGPGRVAGVRQVHDREVGSKSGECGEPGGVAQVAVVAKVAGDGTPRPRDSSSFQPAPMPIQTRPPQGTSSVVSNLARSPGAQ